jgi:diguanylate cyclase (GGDEF)-like protein
LGVSVSNPGSADVDHPALSIAPALVPDEELSREDYRQALGDDLTVTDGRFAGPIVVLIENDVVIHVACGSGALSDGLAATVGQRFEALVHPEDEPVIRSLLDAAQVAEHHQAAAVLRIVGLDGTQRHVEFVAVPERNAAGNTVVLHGWDVTAYLRRERALKTIALHDPLTELPNRLLFGERVAGELGRRRRTGREVAVLYADLDGFKAVNDTWGHRAGDLLLIALSARLRDCVRPGDTVARLGGDEFGICSPDLTSVDDALTVAHRLVDAASAPVSLGGAQVRVAVSVGIALAVDADTLDKGQRLVARADLAMYAAKHAGSSRVAIAPPPSY